MSQFGGAIITAVGGSAVFFVFVFVAVLFAVAAVARALVEMAGLQHRFGPWHGCFARQLAALAVAT